RRRVYTTHAGRRRLTWFLNRACLHNSRCGGICFSSLASEGCPFDTNGFLTVGMWGAKLRISGHGSVGIVRTKRPVEPISWGGSSGKVPAWDNAANIAGAGAFSWRGQPQIARADGEKRS